MKILTAFKINSPKASAAAKALFGICFWWFCFLQASAAKEVVDKDSADSHIDLEEDSSHEEKLKKIQIKSVSDLSKLSPFDDIAVIQKRFLPKTSRYEAGIGPMLILNNKFFYIAGFSGRLGYFIREKHGVGVMGYAVHYHPTILSTRLQEGPNKIIPFNHAAPRFFIGAYYKWTPIYGKFAIFNRHIRYFDMFFDFGLGAVNVITARENADYRPALPMAPAGRISAGQVFAINKNRGLFWNISYFPYFYQLKHIQSGETSMQIEHPLGVSFGVNWYFPTVGIR